MASRSFPVRSLLSVSRWGAHPLDILQWWADQEGLGIPVQYKTTGRIPTEGLYNTATNWQMDATYQNGTKLTFLDTYWARKEDGKIPEGMKGPVTEIGNGTLFVGTNGW